MDTIGDVLKYLQQLPQDTAVVTHFVEDKTFTILVDNHGEARTMRNSDDKRWFFIELPVRQ